MSGALSGALTYAIKKKKKKTPNTNPTFTSAY